MLKGNRSFEAYVDALDWITILLPTSYGTSQKFQLVRGSEQHDLPIVQVTEFPDFMKYECRTDVPIELGQSYLVQDERGGETDLQAGAVIRTKEFDDRYFYDGDDLGVTYTPQESIFKVWAPTALTAAVRLYRPQAEEHPMTRGRSGVWECRIPGNLEGACYTYFVCINQVWQEAIDPYARAVTANGEHGVVIDLAKTRGMDQTVLPPLPSFTDAVIYEAHIRDMTIHPDSGVLHKGLYLGLTEEGTKTAGGTATALEHIKAMGITHIELLPFHDFEGVDEYAPWQQYNWGYNPVHFNAPEGSYATVPDDPYARIRELKQLVASLHRNGIRVIMDAVYNHVYVWQTSPFEKLVPGYYFRHDEYGMPSNGTGVGNDIASERRMVQKFILDSVRYWLHEYGIDGFRFDLMGILDFETMNKIRAELDAVRSDIILLGEGWNLHTPLPEEQKAMLGNAHKMPRIAQFNDRFRDSIKGSTFQVAEKGYAAGKPLLRSELEQLLQGSIGPGGLFQEPLQSVNYVESHDNWTLWDKLLHSNGAESEEVRQRRHLLATAITLLAQGIPFLHAGQEFFRTKHGVENSYNAPDEINWLDWRRNEKYSQAVQYVQGLISLRRSHGAFRLPTAELVQAHVVFPEAPVCVYHLKDVERFGSWKHLVVLFHNEERPVQVPLPYAGEWHVLVNEKQAQSTPIASFTGQYIQIPYIGAYVLAKM